MYEPGNAGKREDCVLVTEDTEQQHVWYPDKCRHQNQYICRICKLFNEDFQYFNRICDITWFVAVYA